MVNIFLIFYWILTVLILVVSGMIIYHIWTYYLNKTLAILTIGLFLGISGLLFLINLIIALRVSWDSLTFVIF